MLSSPLGSIIWLGTRLGASPVTFQLCRGYMWLSASPVLLRRQEDSAREKSIFILYTKSELDSNLLIPEFRTLTLLIPIKYPLNPENPVWQTGLLTWPGIAVSRKADPRVRFFLISYFSSIIIIFANFDYA